jgi:cell division transport system permease protein
VLAVVTIGVALAVLATFAVVVSNLKRVADQLGREVEISAYLKENVDADRRTALAKTIREWEFVADARAVSSAEAISEFRNALGKDAILIEGLPPDILPSSIEVRLAARAWTTNDVRSLADRLSALDGVEDVRFGQEDIERVNALLGFARIAAIVLGAALCFATILIISNTIRLTVYARRDEIEIMSLVGATNAFVRAPFVLEGAIQGFIGGAVASATLLLLEGALKVGIERGLSYAYGPIALQFVPMELIGYLIAAGVLLGLIGSLLAVGRFLRV